MATSWTVLVTLLVLVAAAGGYIILDEMVSSHVEPQATDNVDSSQGQTIQSRVSKAWDYFPVFLLLGGAGYMIRETQYFSGGRR